jgi:HD-like signal output (HDOD) protein
MGADLLHDRLKAFLLFLKPAVLSGGIDPDRLANLRRLSDVRIRKFAIEKPQLTGIDLCKLLADPRVGRFDDLADETGVLGKGHLAAVLPMMAEDMGYLVEACLTLQVAGMAAMKDHAKAFVAKHGAAAAPAGAAPAQAAKAAVAPLPPAVAKALAPIKDLWSLPPSTLKALSLLAAADSPAEAVCAELERDPALAAMLLKLVNASTAPKASSIKKAVVALGYPLTRRFAMTAALALKLAPPCAEEGFDVRAFWLRSLTIAHAAAQISKATKLGSPDEHFSAGLLHAMGRLALAKAGTDAPVAVVASEILARWRFPAAVVEAARHHRDTAEQLEELQLPRESVVVTALHHLLEGETASWAGFLRIAADSIPAILESARKAAGSYE